MAGFDVPLSRWVCDAVIAGEGRFGRLEKTMLLHTWMLGILVVVLVIPQLQAWLA